ncbi:MAG: serine/threonine-protein kinase [Myxococcota bacterium]
MAVAGSIPKGTVLSGKYRIVREIGRGGMAAVYEATNVDIDKRVAIKLLAGHLASSQTVVERFLREARAVSQITSPHICDVYDSGRLEDGAPFLVLELLEGESLYDTMCRERQMTPEVTLTIILQVARGLAKAHELNIVHRDLKPENIFLTRDSEGAQLVKILDFGLAKFYDPVTTTKGGKTARLTREGAVFGTPAYMSPEQVRGQAAADTRADLWALACITYECFTGTTVWSTDDGVAMTFAQIATAPLPDPRRYRPDLPVSFTRWFLRALDREIDKRFQTVAEFADGLAAAFDYEASGLDSVLLSQIKAEAAASSRRRGPATAAPSLPGPASLPSTPNPVEIDDELTQRGRGGAMTKVAGVLVAMLGGVAAAVALGGQEPPEVPGVKRIAPSLETLVAREPARPSGFEFVADHEWLPRVREAQALIAQGELDRALGMLRRVHEQQKHPMIRQLMEQVDVAMEARSAAARCQVTGLGRPRRYDLIGRKTRRTIDTTAPVIAKGLSGALMTWADSREGQRRAYAVALDEELRNRTLPVDITPEGAQVDTPSVVPAAQRFLTAYWDSRGATAGVYLRWLDGQGVIDAPPVAVTDSRAGAYFADVARTPDGGFAVAWAEPRENDSVDLFFRPYGDDGAATGEAVRATDYVSSGRYPTRVREIRAVAHGDALHVAFALVRQSMQQVRLLTVPLGTAAPGLEDLEEKPTASRHLGKELELSLAREKSVLPSLACTDEGCYVAWTRTVRGGAAVAFVEHESGQTLWHKVFSPKGTSPSVAVDSNGEVRIVWIEGGHVVTAPLGREGVGRETQIAKVTGKPPPPSLTAGDKGEWYVSWLDFEASGREPYVARVKCD